jgi:ribosomal protein S18 acetylase RimI-like enzyme
MNRYRFELATPADDADLRHVLAATPMDGRVRVGFRREPSWFDAAVVDGRWRQVIACRDLETERVFGFGCRSITERYVNGTVQEVGYLSSLRVLPEYRNLGLVARGYAFMRQTHQDGRTPFYVTTIAAGNDVALKVLTSGRAGLPTYQPAGTYYTFALPLGPRGAVPTAASSIRPARNEDLPAILEFLARAGRHRQFFPRYGEDDFRSAGGLLRGLKLEDVLLAQRDGQIVGTLATWDQHRFRQSVVYGYGGWLHSLRPMYNLLARLRGRAVLPAPGEELRCLTAALPVVADDDPQVFAALLDAARQRVGGGPWSHLLVGLHEADPLLPVLRRYRAASYATHLYVVSWEDGRAAIAALDGRPPYLELGSL